MSDRPTSKLNPLPLPVKPYAGTSGHSGGATSEERALREDADGTTGKRQALVLDLLRDWGENGMTVREVLHETGLHHGQASSALTHLHKGGLAARLTERRSKCFVYVLPEFVNGREVSEPGRKSARVLTDLEEQQLRGATQAVEGHGMGLPMWRAQQLIEIINRIRI